FFLLKKTSAASLSAKQLPRSFAFTLTVRQLVFLLPKNGKLNLPIFKVR
ncbi:unnamed protein product, partial [Larinioides sclopetarius]